MSRTEQLVDQEAAYREPTYEPHGVNDATYEGVVGDADCLPRISCDCGFYADGLTWAEAGAGYDKHLNGSTL